MDKQEGCRVEERLVVKWVEVIQLIQMKRRKEYQGQPGGIQ